MPHFSVIPIHGFVRPHPTFGREKISFRKKDIQFSNLYVVQGQDESLVRATVNAPVRHKMKQLGLFGISRGQWELW